MSAEKSYHMTTEEFRRYGRAVVDWIADYFQRVESLPVLSQVELADSYCFNPHKWMFTNFDGDLFSKTRPPIPQSRREDVLTGPRLSIPLAALLPHARPAVAGACPGNAHRPPSSPARRPRSDHRAP
jgi:hypothetical protein